MDKPKQKIKLSKETSKLFYTIPHFARLCEMSTKHIYREIDRGNIPAYELSERSTRILISEAQEYLNKKRLKPKEKQICACCGRFHESQLK